MTALLGFSPSYTIPAEALLSSVVTVAGILLIIAILSISQLRSARSRQTLLLDVTRAMLAEDRGEAALAQLVFTKVAAAMGAEMCLVYGRDRTAENLRLVAALGAPPEFMAPYQTLSPGESFCSVVAYNARPLTADASQITRDLRGAMARSLGAQAYAGHPLVDSNGEVLGTLAFMSTRRSRFSAADLDFLETLSLAVALAWQRRRAGGALRESEATLSAVLDALPVGVVIADARGRVIRDNAANGALWGVPPNTAGWGRFGDWVVRHAETRQPLTAEEWAMSRALTRGEVITGEMVEVERFDTGERRFHLNNAAPVRNESGRIVAGVVVQLDVTEARRAQQVLETREARWRELLATLDLGTAMTRGLDGTIRYWSAGCERLYGWRPEEARGRNAHFLLDTIYPAPEEDILQILEQQGEWTGDARQRTRDGRILTVTVRQVLHRDAPDGPAIMESLTDVTAQRAAEEQLAAREGLLRGIIETAPCLIYARDRRGRMLLANAPAQELIGRPLQDQGPVVNLPSGRNQAADILETDLQTMQAGETREIEEQLGEIDGWPRIWLSTKSPLRDGTGQIVGVVGVSIEITERKQAEERRRLILDELNHRVKNTLVTVQSITQQTLRGIDVQLRDALEGRLLALAAAHDVLVREQWESASLEEVVTASLAPHGGRHSPRFEVSGPPLRLRPRAALALAMGLHELATNAVKYGALSMPAGQVALHWEVIREGSPRFHMSWTEHGGPPATPPSRRGFGTRLLERSLTQDLRGKVQINYLPTGLVCVIDAPLAEVAPGAVVLPHRGVNGQAQAVS